MTDCASPKLAPLPVRTGFAPALRQADEPPGEMRDRHDPGPDARTWLDPRACAFFLDVDGTLLDIAAHPDAVVVPEGLRDDLDCLCEQADGAVALVSGRSIAALDAIFHPLRLPAAGIHGAELRRSPDAPPEAAPNLSTSLRAMVGTLAGTLDGAWVEDKGLAVAVHYRDEPDIGPRLKRGLETIAAAGGDEIEVMPGKLVFEVKRRALDKGGAVRAFMAEHGFQGRTPIFIGDDVTDEAGFRAARELGGLAIAVGRAFPDCDRVLSGPAEVRDLIRMLSASGRACACHD